MLKDSFKISRFIIRASLLFFALFFSSSAAQAASMYLSPALKSLNVGQSVNLAVFISSSDQAINSAEAAISYPKDLLEATAVSKSGSIFSLWVEEPVYSNSTGRLSFTGGLPTPGFTGSGGRIVTVTLKAKKAGRAAVSFASASIRANDGLGTNVFNGSAGAEIVITDQNTNEEKTEPSSETKKDTEAARRGLAAPRISSRTNPDQNSWYTNKNVSLSWPLPSEVSAIRLLVSNRGDEEPSVVYAPPISQKEISDLDDGVWYFHAQFKDKKSWGEIAHFRLQIDGGKPDYFNIKAEDLEGQSLKFYFDAQDKISGIDRYEVSIDGGQSIVWKDDGSHIFVAPPLAYGSHSISAKAFDRAGNYLISDFNFNVETIKAPVFSEYPKELEIGTPLVLKGRAAPNSKIRIWLDSDNSNKAPEIFELSSDKDGNFTYKSEGGLEEGQYKIYAQAEDAAGRKSAFSEKIIIKVKQVKIIRDIYKIIASLLVVIAFLVVVIVFILFKMHQLRRMLLAATGRRKERKPQRRF